MNRSWCPCMQVCALIGVSQIEPVLRLTDSQPISRPMPRLGVETPRSEAFDTTRWHGEGL